MPRDEIIRLRCTAADKERLKEAAQSAGESLSNFVLYAAKLRASQQEHGAVTRTPVKVEHVPENVELSGGISLGKRSFTPDPK